MSFFLAILIQGALASPDGPDLPSPSPDVARLAPTIQDLRQDVAVLERLLRDSEAIGQAVGRLHALWAARIPPTTFSACGVERAPSVAARSYVFGEAYREAVQSARAQADRVAPMVGAPTLAPLLSAEEAERIEALQVAVRQHVRWYGEMSSWHLRFIAPRVNGCLEELAPAPGVLETNPEGRDEVLDAVAIAAVGGGVVCPLGLPAHGQVIVVPGGAACYGDAGCACEPGPVASGAVLGPVAP